MNEPKQRTVSASYMDTLLDAFAETGGSRTYLLQQAGLDDTALKDPDARLPVETVSKIWMAAKEKTANPMLGLQVGNHIRPGSFSVLGHLLMTAATVRDALENASRFAALVGDGGLFTVTMDGGDAVLDYDLVEKNIPCREERVEAVMASLVGFSRWITGQEIVPGRVHFMHAPLANIDAYEAIFLTTPDFRANRNSIILLEKDLDLPLLQSNPRLSSVLVDHAETVLAQVNPLPPFLLRLHQAIDLALKEGPPELEAITQTLGMTPRSVQRKLNELNTTFQDQLNELRCERAMDFLENNDKPISEISYLLGFSDPASFNRAFKRWTGKPPATWRIDKTADS